VSNRLVRSRLFDDKKFVHGFPERTGGLSVGARASLNLGYRWGDDPDRVQENRKLLADHAGFAIDDLVATKHVHGVNVYKVGDPLPDPPEFDGLVSNQAGPVLGAFAADCLPLLFADPETGNVGAAHAGWRGTVGGVAARVVEAMTALGSKPGNIRVALGPSIGPCCFEVGPEVVAQFRDAFGDVKGMVVPGPKKDHIDLRCATRFVLEKAGVAPSHIDDTPPCTRCEAERFFSYRRDGFEGGVHMAFIGRRKQS
jgi:YfiH family protein